MNFKKLLSLLLALAMLITATCIAQAAPAAGKYHVDGDTLYMEGSCFDAPVWNLSDVTRVVQRATDLLRVEAPIRFEPYRILTDTVGNLYYVFLQMVGDTTDYGGAVKVVTDPDGDVLGVTASVERELPEGYTLDDIGADGAEQVVAKAGGGALVPDATEQVLLPVQRDVNMDIEVEKEEYRNVWAVYTENPDPARPYRVHYVTLNGEYLYDMPVKTPGDEASVSGYDAAYTFDNMEPADYTGKVTLSDGTTREITVTLMRDMDTGTYYLGNLERRIAVADCYEMLYNKGHVVLESSPDNTGWDDTCLISLYNYCRAWDFYNDIGWNAGDGRGTPTLILKDFCDKEHNPIDNAAYAGPYYGWQIFLSSSANDMGQCLDVLAHEFTHCVTHAAMTHNAYKNDYGAINEAMSDIQGNLCEMTYNDTTDTTWLMGENGRTTVRSMSDPHRFRQPEFSWDLYYNDLVRDPTEINDHGGVHSNSSLLNNVAYRLCTDGGMTLAEAHAFWFAVDLTMVPSTDHAQLRLLLPWVMQNLGLEKYLPALQTAMEATRLGQQEVPEVIPNDRALVTLALPDEARFTDGNWMLVIPSADLAGAFQRLRSIINRTGDYATALDELEAMVAQLAPDQVDENGKLKPNVDKLVDRVFELLDKENAQLSEEDKVLAAKLKEWFQKTLSDVLCLVTGSAGEDGRTIRMMTQKGLSLPVLVRLETEPNSMLLKSLSVSVYIFGSWIDLTAVLGEVLNDPSYKESLKNPESAGEASESAPPTIPGLDLLMSILGTDTPQDPAEDSELTLDDVNFALDKLEALGTGMSWIVDLFFYNIPGGRATEMPTEGLTDVTLLEGDSIRSLLVDFQSASTESEK